MKSIYYKQLPAKAGRIMTVYLLLLALLFCESAKCADEQVIKELQAKEQVRIMVTDSGLGGLSVAAAIDSMLRVNKCFKEAEVIFFNALPDAFFKYNNLPDMESKARVFSLALEAMQREYKPDVILIACNTLSVVYPFTSFAKNSTVPVLGIVDMGVRVIADSLNRHPGSKAIILGTETTIGSKSHLGKLVAMGIDSARVVNQACPNLETEIQSNPAGDMTESLIDFYLDESREKDIKQTDKIYAALCCTHYGYAAAAFEKKLRSIAGEVEIINPNKVMAGLFNMIPANRFENTVVNTAVVSQAELTEEETNGVGMLIRQTSGAVSEALMHYKKLDGVIIVK